MMITLSAMEIVKRGLYPYQSAVNIYYKINIYIF